MAKTLTEPEVADEGMVHVSFPILKWEQDEDGDLVVKGVATDGTVDHDSQIVEPGWSGDALQAWMATGANVRMAHDPQRPVGKGLKVEVNKDGSGKHWVTSVIVDPLAQKLVKKGVLTAYSVGISRPVIKHDPSGRARGGIIVGGELSELSIVDRPSCKNAYLELAKSAPDGTCQFTGKVYGADDETVQKALGGDLLTKDAGPAADASRFGFPEDLSVTFTPNDMARLMQAKIVEKHYAGLAAQAAGADSALKAIADAERAVYKRDIDTATRRRLASEGHALPDGSYPIENTGDLHNAAILALAGHGAAAGAKRRIAREARERGGTNPLDRDGKKDGGEDEAQKAYAREAVAAGVISEAEAAQITAAKEAGPDLAKSCSGCSGGNCDGASCSCGSCTDGKCACGSSQKAAGEPKPKTVKKAKKPKKMPPWLNKPKDDDGDDGDSGACKSAADHLWAGVIGSSDIVCSKCHTTPAQAAGVTASLMDPAPVGELMESTAPRPAMGATPQPAAGASDAPAMQPVPRHREPDGGEVEAFERDSGMSDGDSEGPTRLEAPTLKNASPEVLAMLRFKSIGIEEELGRLHDLTCPAYHPDDVAKYHPFADLHSLIDEAHWQAKALDAACGPLEHAIAMQELTAFALALKSADASDVNDWRLEAHKAFRDANPGPGTYPTPGSVSPRGFSRPLLTDGRSASSPGHSGPTTSPVVAAGPPSAMSFDRPPMGAGQESPSPSFMKWDSGQYPSETGMPVQLNYAHLEKERQRVALARMHDHLSRQFPAVCPLDSVDLTGNASRPLRGIQPEGHPVPATAGIGKADHAGAGAAAMREAAATGQAVPFATGTGIALPPATKASAPAAAAVKAEPEAGADRFADADVYKGFKKQRKKLGKKVLAGKMTVDEARAQMGRRFAQKRDASLTELLVEQVHKGLISIDEARAKLNLPPWGTPEAGAVPAHVPSGPQPLAPVAAKAAAPVQGEVVSLTAGNFGMDPEVIEAAVTKAVAPLLEKIQQQDETYTAKLAETQRVIDAIADQPDPSTASFSGLAFQPVRKTARPAGVTDIAEAAVRARLATERELENLYESASDPFAREGFYAALNKVRGGAPNS